MKKEVIFCDLCPAGPAEKQNYAIYNCVICGRDCCSSHSGAKLPQVMCVEPYRATCSECGAVMDPSKFPPVPEDLIDALFRWQDSVIEQTKAEIAARTLREVAAAAPHDFQSETMKAYRDQLKAAEQETPPKIFPRRQMW
jgi:hypothetical protein